MPAESLRISCRPKGHRANKPMMRKLAIPNGMPTIVMHQSAPARKYARHIHRPEKTNQSRFMRNRTPPSCHPRTGVWTTRRLRAGRLTQTVDALFGPAGHWLEASAKGSPMAWNLAGSYSETCSCELMCPCNMSFDHGATYDFCRVTLAFSLREGSVDGTDIAGRKVVLIADTPKVMTDGNWRVGVFVDEDASEEQFDKLVQVFGGQLGGPMAGLAPLIGEMLGVQRAAIDIEDDGLLHSVRVDDVIDFQIQDIVPFGVETGEPVRFAGMFHPVGSDLVMAEAKRTRIDAFGITYEGKTGLSKSSFSWAA